MMPSKYVPKPKLKMMPCRYCGIGMYVGWKTKKQPAHIACAARRMCEHNVNLHNKSGPDYDRWRAGMERFFANQPQATPVSAENNLPVISGDLYRSNGYASPKVRVRTRSRD